MAKIKFTKGDCVTAKKWNGEEFIGLYEFTYDDGEHCIIDVKTNKRFCSHNKDVKLASDSEAKEIKQLAKENKTKPMENISTTTETIDNEELEEALAATE